MFGQRAKDPMIAESVPNSWRASTTSKSTSSSSTLRSMSKPSTGRAWRDTLEKSTWSNLGKDCTTQSCLTDGMSKLRQIWQEVPRNLTTMKSSRLAPSASSYPSLLTQTLWTRRGGSSFTARGWTCFSNWLRRSRWSPCVMSASLDWVTQRVELSASITTYLTATPWSPSQSKLSKASTTSFKERGGIHPSFQSWTSSLGMGLMLSWQFLLNLWCSDPS